MTQADRERLLAELTEQQREVVGQLSRGPVKVVAAAGSGKTRTMATLYALAVLDGIPPARILAVTFTDRGAEELRSRVAATIGGDGPPPDVIGSAWIGTFHALMRRLLSERWYEAGVPPQLGLLDDSGAALVMEEAAAAARRRIAAAGPAAAPPEAGGPDLVRVAGGAVEATRRLRATELTPQECERLSARAYSAFADAGDPVGELAWHRFGLQATLAVWEEYERRLAQAGATDFDGLLRTALAALADGSPLAAWCQTSFRLVIVDEYQDTSPIQASLLARLCGPHLERLFVVGDPRQSIFAFRDAQPGVMSDHPGRTLTLSRNHRSLEPILTAAERVIRVDPKFGDDTRLEAHRATPPGLPVLLGVAPDPRSEAEGVADLLGQLLRDGISHSDGTRQQVTFGDIAVLAPTLRRIGAHLEEALRSRGIPFQTAAGGLMGRPEVKDAIAMLRAAVDPADGHAWVRVLQGPLWRVSDRDLSLLLAANRNQSVPGRLEEALADAGNGLGPEVRTAVLAAIGLIRMGATGVQHRSGAAVLNLLVERSGLRTYHDGRARAGSADGARALASLEELNRVAQAIESGGRFVPASELLRRLELAEDRRGTREPPPPASASQVTVSTIHRAKGLEWPVVVLADCRPFSSRGQPPLIWDRGAQALVVSSVGGERTAARRRWDASADAGVEREERTRLVYVAMTRARDLLVVTTTRPATGVGPGATLGALCDRIWGGERLEGEFVELVAGLAAGAPWVAELPGFPAAVALPWTGADSGHPREPAPPPGPDLMTLVERWRRVRDLGAATVPPDPRPPRQLSFSSLVTLERCPRWFWFEHVAGFQAPGAGDGSAESGGAPADRALRLGSLAHRALERFHREHPRRGPHPGELLASLPPAIRDEDRDQLAPMMEAYSGMEVARLPTVGVEVSFRWREWAGPESPPLVGAVDRVAALPGGEFMVLDYKTDRHIDPDDLLRHGRQLGLYTLAIESGLLGSPRPARAGLVLLRSGEFLEVDTSGAATSAALAWAAGLARSAGRPDQLSAVGRARLPCATCPHSWFCPERGGTAGSPPVGADSAAEPATPS